MTDRLDRIPPNIDRKKLEDLLTTLAEETINKPEALELKPMLEQIDRTATILVGLGLFILKAKDDNETYKEVRTRLYSDLG